MARVGKIKSLNCYNYGCVDDRVAIFGSKVWFSGSANLMVSVTLISYSSTEISTISIILQIFFSITMYNCRASQFRLLSILCWTEFFSVDFVDYFCHYLRESVSFCQSQSAVHLFLYVLITSRNHVLFTLRVVDVIRIIRRTMCGAGAKSINSRQCLTNC